MSVLAPVEPVVCDASDLIEVCEAAESYAGWLREAAGAPDRADMIDQASATVRRCMAVADGREEV